MIKRMISFLLIITLSLALLAGCGGKGTKNGAALSLGYAKIDSTPTESLPLGGYQGNDAPQYRWSTATEWPFNAICVVFTDADGNSAMLITLDLINAGMSNSLRSAISNIVGIPKEHIMIHATHNHSGPAVSYSAPEIYNYLTLMTNSVITAAKNAMDNRLPVTGMKTTYARPEGHNSERHYLLADGSYQSYGVGSVPKDQLIGHYGVADNLLQLVKFERDGGKDVVLVNWQGHPPGTNPKTIATANYPAVLCDYLNKHWDCESVFFLSGSGNLNNGSQIAGEIIHEDYQGLGEGLGAAGVAAAASFTDRSFEGVRVKEKMLQLENRNYGVDKVYVYAITIGDFAMVTAPFEIFDDNAVAVRENSPYAMTMYLSCCNGSHGYLPTPPSFDWKITYESRITKFPKGTAEIVQDELIGMLKELATENAFQTVEKPADYYQAEFVPKTDGVTYMNMNPGDLTKYSQVQNDFFAFQLFANNKVKNHLCKDEALVKEILEKTEVKLIFNEQSVVVGIVE